MGTPKVKIKRIYHKKIVLTQKGLLELRNSIQRKKTLLPKQRLRTVLKKLRHEVKVAGNIWCLLNTTTCFFMGHMSH